MPEHNPPIPITCACGCNTTFMPAAPNHIYATIRCQKRAERKRRSDRSRNGPRFSADQIASQKLADWHREQAEIDRGTPGDFDPVQAAIDAAMNPPNHGQTL